MSFSAKLLAALGLAATLASVPAAAQAGVPTSPPRHPGLPGARPLFEAPFPARGPSAGGYSSDNVEFVKNFPQHSDSAGARKVGDFFYITTERDLTIYDVTTPADPVEVGSMVLPEPGQPIFTEEDPDTNGKVLLVSNGGILMVIDVSDKTEPKLLSTLDDADDHTVSCVLDCTWAYGSEGTIVDLRDPANPRLSDNNWQTGDIESRHDVTEVSPGMVVTSTQPLKLLDARIDPEHPTVVGTTPKEPGRFTHANLWPRGGQDDFLLVGGEAVGPGCSDDVSASFSTWDARSWRQDGVVSQIDEFRLAPGLVTDGRAPESSYCVHWFDEHPYYENGGLVAIGWYEHGTHFLQIGKDGSIAEVGWFVGGGGQASAAYWIDERTVYVADYLRGLDVLRFNGEIGTPPAGQPVEEEPGSQPGETQTGGEGQAQAPANQQQTAQTEQTSGPDTTCATASAFASAAVEPRGRGLDLKFTRTSGAADVVVDVLRTSAGRRLTGMRRVARFAAAGDGIAWNGRANRPKRRVTDGHYIVRFRSGTETRRLAVRRAGGRWSTRPAFDRGRSCDLVREFALGRPVFGGRRNKVLDIAYTLERDAEVTVTVLRGSKVVKRFAARAADAGRTHRLRFGAHRRKRGDYRVRLEAGRDGERVVAETVARRL